MWIPYPLDRHAFRDTLARCPDSGNPTKRLRVVHISKPQESKRFVARAHPIHATHMGDEEVTGFVGSWKG